MLPLRTLPDLFLPSSWRLDFAPVEVQECIVQSCELLGLGAFSLVMALDDHHALKLTTCEATQTIFPQLVNKPTAGLPLVFKDYGLVGYVESAEGYYDDIPIHAYLMERLVKPNQLAYLRKDSCPRGAEMSAHSIKDAIGAYRWLARALRKNVDPALEVHHNEHSTVSHPLVGQLAQLLGHTRFKPLVRATHRLGRRVLSGEWDYDWIRRFEQNVLVSRWGEPILADPVYSPRQDFWKTAYPGLYKPNSYCRK